MDINHIHLAVRDLEKSKQFYIDTFGFFHKIDHGKTVFLTNNEGFDLALDPKAEPTPLPAWFHIGSRLQSADQVRALYDKFATQQPEHIKHKLEVYDDFVFFRCLDPDGNEIEVYWE